MAKSLKSDKVLTKFDTQMTKKLLFFKYHENDNLIILWFENCKLIKNAGHFSNPIFEKLHIMEKLLLSPFLMV